MRRAIPGAVLVLLLAAPARLLSLTAGERLVPATAEASLVLGYDMRYGPLTLVEMQTTVDLAAAHYRAETTMQTVGVVGFVFPWTSHARTSGLRSAAGLRPQQHRSEGNFRGEKRLVEIDYEDSGGLRVHAEPAPSADWREAVSEDLRRDTIDPLTASLAAMETGCAGIVRVFDGRRRYNLRLSDMGEDEVEAASNQIYTGPARRCRAVVEALGGFWVTDPRQGETPTTLDSWIAPPRPGLVPVPVYLELSGARGTLSIHLAKVSDVSAAPAAP
jgi:hypothetical protein